jgi:hypothetical protein
MDSRNGFVKYMNDNPPPKFQKSNAQNTRPTVDLQRIFVDDIYRIRKGLVSIIDLEPLVCKAKFLAKAKDAESLARFPIENRNSSQSPRLT